MKERDAKVGKFRLLRYHNREDSKKSLSSLTLRSIAAP